MTDKDHCCKAPDPKDIEDHVMNPSIPKSEGEHWAKRKIKAQAARIAELEAASAWRAMKDAPKGATQENICKEHWILGINKFGEQRVIRWCLEYPCNKGVWMYGYEPNDYIDGIKVFEPTHWQPLPTPPEGIDG